MINKSIRLFLRVNWLRTIIFNIRYFKWKQAMKLPVFIYGSSRCYGRGKYVLPNKLATGMIKLGINHEPCCILKQGIHLKNNGVIIFSGSGIIGNGSSITVERNAYFQIGTNFGITGNFTMHCGDTIKIGNNFSCSWDVSISDTDHHQCLDPETKILYPMTAPIVISDNVWCCQHVIISKGTRIPQYTTIAQMSLANKKYEIPPYSILAGIPAKSMTKKLKRTDISKITEISDAWMITSGLKIFNNIQ